ncbi:carbohydrate-binding family 9-like protein [Anaerocolumna sp. MB42-C2]|uniref:carbohydrate-binding family 9-like protein n=1 Tax=Anaerocolumna sp. MB42-C2 TaxID=3070997 RepID=UPI0027DFABFC|nr:carbohydrate-binding family 9-like protein [Anaerocolumna sp. MB42-C2]WMJ86606.1 carbohydrate-binding family 9-like protein [Anaerocolumna sp. MB42-C2]
MNYEIHTIREKSGLADCPFFYVDKYNWGGEYRPVTYGKMAYMKEKGFIIQMTCEEKDPLRIYHKNEDPVFLDSAMEAFIEFAPDTKKGTYVNIEMNGNGAMLNRYGQVPPGRKAYTEFTDAICTCEAFINENSWTVEANIPLQYIKDLFNKDTFKPGDIIRCNFYKLCASDIKTQHYGSYTVINNPSWNFHMPEYFADAVILN